MHVNAFADWSAQLLRAKRESFVLVMNTRSLYSVIAPASGIVTPLALEARLFAHIKSQLYSDGLEFFCRRLLDRDGEATLFAKMLNSRTEATLHDFSELAQYYLGEEELSLEATAGKINSTMLSLLDHSTPRHTFQTMGF